MKFTIPDFDVAHSHWDAFHIFRTFSFDLLYLESVEMHDLWDNNEWNPKWDAKFQHKEHCFLGPMFWKFDDEEVHTWNGGNSGDKRSGFCSWTRCKPRADPHRHLPASCIVHPWTVPISPLTLGRTQRFGWGENFWRCKRQGLLAHQHSRLQISDK